MRDERMHPQAIQAEEARGLERVIDLSQVPRPERLVEVLDAAQEALRKNPEADTAIFEQMVEVEFMQGYHLLERFGQYLRDSYMPNSREETIQCGCVGLGYLNNEKDDPRAILLRVKEADSGMAKIFGKSQGRNVVYATNPDVVPASEDVYKLSDVLAARFVCKTEEGRDAMIQRLYDDKNIRVLEEEHINGGRSGMYFAVHLLVEYEGREYELQMHTDASHRMSKLDREVAHPNEKYDWKSKALLAQEDYKPEVS